MADNTIQVPNNIEDKTVLKRFLTQLVLGINSTGLLSNNKEIQNAAILEILQNNPTLDFLNLVSKLTELRTDILTYVEDNIETIILQNTEDIAVIAEQFGTFYEQALAASWYGLSVKAGGAVAGLEIGSLDPDVTTPNDEKSYFRVVADNFIVGRAYEDLTQEEKDYLSANGLPAFGTVYNASKQPVPALITTWSSSEHVYKHYFNGIVQFTNISGTPTINKTYVQATAPSVAVIGDTWLNTSASYASFTYNGATWISTGNKTYIQSSMPTFGCISGDVWVDNGNNNRTYRYDGNSWIDTTIDAALAVNNGTTTINGGKITTNTLSANRLSPSTNGVTVWSGGGLVSQNFNGNAVGNIGTPTQGFRLSSDALGTSSDPNIFGAYIKGAILEGAHLKYGDSKLLTSYNTYAPYSIFSSVNYTGATSWYEGYFDRLYSPSNTTGSDNFRLSRFDQTVLVFGSMACDYSTVYIYIQYKYSNSADWVTAFQGGDYMDYRYSFAFSIAIQLKSDPYDFVDIKVFVNGYLMNSIGASMIINNI